VEALVEAGKPILLTTKFERTPGLPMFLLSGFRIGNRFFIHV